MAVLRVARPMRRKRSTVHQFRRRIPLDVIERARGLTIDVPLAPGMLISKRISAKATDVTLSLRACDKSEAEKRHAAVAAHLECVWQGLRCTAPIALTHKEAVALAGDFYRGWAQEPEGGDQGITAVGIVRAGVGSSSAVQVTRERPLSEVLSSSSPGGNGMDLVGMVWKAAAQSPSVNAESLRPVVARFLINKGMGSLDDASRGMLLHEVERAIREAFKSRERNARGDYSPDAVAQRFPPPLPGRPNGAGSMGMTVATKGTPLSLTDLYEAWRVHPEQEHVAQSTKANYSDAFENFSRFLPPAQRADDSSITSEDVQRFLDHRMTEVKPKTVKDNDLTALKSIFGWAVGKRLLQSNPTHGITVKIRKEPKSHVPRPKGFTDAEARAVLAHAYRCTEANTKRESPKTVAAKRWVPWLCAYSGARVGEMAQLRRQDVRRAGEHWVITLTPDAGTIKDKTARELPVHPHLIEQGFIAFVEASGDGHLFLTVRPVNGAMPLAEPIGKPEFRYKRPRKASRLRTPRQGKVRRTDDERGILGPLKAINNRLREFVRQVVTDKRVQPNHGWRHRFRTVGREAGVEERILDEFTGNAPGTVGAGYGDVTIQAMANAHGVMPRYE